MTANTINDAQTIAGNGEGALLAGRYRVVRQLGQGGMGSVWLAEDTQLDNKLFAIKMLPAILVSNKRAYRQLKDEALVAMKLTHPNIVTLRAFEENNGNPFLVMDYINGQTLDDYLAENGKLSEDEALRVLRPIAAALDYAHAKGVVHRDVKPGNVMIAKDGTSYILDFGIAREIQETMTRVTGKLSSGTLLYMSPEQLMGESPKPAQDVYSFAAMAYECLKGEPPFVRGAIEDQIKNKQPDPLPTEVLTGNAAILAAGVMSGLAKQPEDRPASCTAALEGSVFSRAEHVERVDGNGVDVPPPQEPRGAAAYTQADCVRLMADAKVVQRHIARYSEDSDYRSDFQEIADEFVRADAIFAEKQWGLAAECFARIVQRGKSLEEAVARRAALPKTGDEKVLVIPGGEKMELIYVAPGSFMMGSPNSEDGRRYDEMQHHVTLTNGYWMGKYPVTQRQWRSVMGNNPSYFNGEEKVYEKGAWFWKKTWKTEAFDSANHPVECISWYDCQVFVKKVNAALGCGARLPTEAEWEYACRAGTNGPFGGNGGLDDMGWYTDNSGGVTHAVGQKLANAWGFYDMHGNVWELCQDWYGADYYAKSPTKDPQGPTSGVSRVLRGGCCFAGAWLCRSACRLIDDPSLFIDCFGFGYCFGFRLCCSAGLRE